MTTTAQTNYTDAQVVEIVQAYQAGQTVDEIAETVGKSVRSVIAKLSREGVYQPKAKAKGAGRLTKAQLIAYVEDLPRLDPKSLQSLEKASLTELQLLAATLTNKIN